MVRLGIGTRSARLARPKRTLYIFTAGRRAGLKEAIKIAEKADEEGEVVEDDDVVHNSNARIQNLELLINMEGVPRRSFQVSDVKQDGMVFVKFKSDDDATSAERACHFTALMCRLGKEFMQVDDRMFRLALSQF